MPFDLPPSQVPAEHLLTISLLCVEGRCAGLVWTGTLRYASEIYYFNVLTKLRVMLVAGPLLLQPILVGGQRSAALGRGELAEDRYLASVA